MNLTILQSFSYKLLFVLFASTLATITSYAGSSNNKPTPVLTSTKFFNQSSSETIFTEHYDFIALVDRATVCREVLKARPDASRHPMFYEQSASGACTAANSYTLQSGRYYADEYCETEFDYVLESDLDYCLREFDVKNIEHGNSKDLPDDYQSWQLGYSSIIDASTWSDEYAEVPLLQRQTYAIKDNGSAQCHLEMRVYKKAGNESGTPLMLLHGGGWLIRYPTALRAEAQIAHLTEAGFVVYMPFYRLIEQDQGGAACNNVTVEDTKLDIKSAFEWIKANNDRYTTSDEGYRLIGQSAGGHMGIWLAQQFPGEIEKLAPMFGVPDFGHQIYELKTTENGKPLYESDYISGMTMKVINTYHAAQQPPLPELTFDELDLNNLPDIVKMNSMLNPVEDDPNLFPSVFAVHGMADTIVSPSQTIRICNALNQELDSGLKKNDLTDSDFNQGQFSAYCGNGSEIHLLKNAEHHFDYNCSFDFLAKNGCRAGNNDDDTQAAASVLQNMVEWLK